MRYTLRLRACVRVHACVSMRTRKYMSAGTRHETNILPCHFFVKRNGHILSGEDKDDGARYFFWGKRDDEIHIYAYQYEVGKRGERRMLKGTYNTQ